MKEFRRFLLACVLVSCCCAAGFGQTQAPAAAVAGDDSPARIKDLMARAGERVRNYQEAMFSIAFTEAIRQQELKADSASKGRPRELVYESLVLTPLPSQSPKAAFPLVTRTLKSVDGKRAEKQSLPRRSKCVDINPRPAYADPLTFLLPEHQKNFTFSYEGEGDFEGRRVVFVGVASPAPTTPLEIKTEGTCFSLSRSPHRTGRLWIDTETHDVLQLEWRLAEEFEAKTPTKVVRKGIFFVFSPSRKISYERMETTIRFRTVKFENPEQTLLLPVSSESVWVIKGARIAGYSTTTSFTNYKRFITSVEVKDDPDEDKD